MSGVAPTRSEYYRDQMVRFKTTVPFVLNGSPIDPEGVTCQYKNPTGTEITLTYGTDPALKRLSTGMYYVDVVLDTPGEWQYRFESSGDVEAVAEGAVFVLDTVF